MNAVHSQHVCAVQPLARQAVVVLTICPDVQEKGVALLTLVSERVSPHVFGVAQLAPRKPGLHVHTRSAVAEPEDCC